MSQHSLSPRKKQKKKRELLRIRELLHVLTRSSWTWGTTTFYVDKQTYVDIGRICAEDAKQMSEINGGSYVLMPQPISQSMVEAANQTIPNAMGLRPRAQICEGARYVLAAL